MLVCSAALLDRALAATASRGFGADAIRVVHATAAGRASAPPWAHDAGIARHDAARLAFNAARGRAVPVRALLDAGADIDGVDAREWTALLHAASGSQVAAVRVLIDRGADVGARDGDEQTALQVAAAYVNADVVAPLLRRGVGVDDRDAGGRTPLVIACFNDRAAIAAELLSCDADVNEWDACGRTPLMFVAKPTGPVGTSAAEATVRAQLAAPACDATLVDDDCDCAATLTEWPAVRFLLARYS